MNIFPHNYHMIAQSYRNVAAVNPALAQQLLGKISMSPVAQQQINTSVAK